MSDNSDMMDYKGRQLAEGRITRMAMFYLDPSRNKEIEYPPSDYTSDRWFSPKEYPGLRKLVDVLLETESWGCKEFGPASNPQFIERYAKKAAELYRQNKNQPGDLK